MFHDSNSNSFKVPQCTTVEDSAASQGISLEGIVLNNGEDIGDRVTADTTSVDYKNIEIIKCTILINKY